jgi:hypothetical protein
VAPVSTGGHADDADQARRARRGRSVAPVVPRSRTTTARTRAIAPRRAVRRPANCGRSETSMP